MANKRTILILGGGGREHAIAWKLAHSEKVSKLYVAPGNGGTASIAENVALDIMDGQAVVEFARKHHVDLVIVTPDDPLAAGLVDALTVAGIRAFGPTRAAARIESSKAFSKKLMDSQSVPTASYQTFDNYELAQKYIKNAGFPLVIKASGLALGKGVYVCRTMVEAETALVEIMRDGKFGTAGSQVIIEEFLTGQEVSLHAICDGKSAVMFPGAQDHKQVGEGDAGSNTGGMGVIAPVPGISAEFVELARAETVDPILRGLSDQKTAFKGCLYPGIMVQDTQVKVLEYNARFGDPETQVYMRLLESDLLELIEASIDGAIDEVKPRWRAGFAVCVVVAAGGYPGAYRKGDEISGLGLAAAIDGIKIFHAGTTVQDGQLATNGGRVLGVTATGTTLQGALDRAYAAVKLIHFKDMFYRRDIGWRVLSKK